ncbi:MAG: SRPBCC family protein [Asticcacaulis sp.]
MDIQAVAPGRAVDIGLEFIKPFPNKNTVEFTFVPGDDGKTTVIWAMFGPTPFVGKIMHTVFNMDKLVGGDFEKGLASLKNDRRTPRRLTQGKLR